MIFPQSCMACGKFDYSETANLVGFCGSCFKDIFFLEHDAIQITDGGLQFFDVVFCACYFKGAMREAIHRFKFNNHPSYYRMLAKLLFLRYGETEEMLSADMVIGVPMQESKLIIRGYNQAELLAKGYAKLANIEDGSQFIRKIKETKTQSGLNKSERVTNVSAAFKVGESLYGKKIILIDDIYTTGSTLNECAVSLKMAGAKKVFCLVLASSAVR